MKTGVHERGRERMEALAQGSAQMGRRGQGLGARRPRGGAGVSGKKEHCWGGTSARFVLGSPQRCHLLAGQRRKTAPRGPMAAQCHVEAEEQRGVPRRAMEGGERRSGGACEGSPRGEEGRGPGDRWESREEAPVLAEPYLRPPQPCGEAEGQASVGISLGRSQFEGPFLSALTSAQQPPA